MSTIRTSAIGPLSGNTATVVDAATPTNGSATLSPLVSFASQATTSGTSVSFTGIPSWAKRITVMCASVSTTGTGTFGVQLGTSGGFVTSGYTGSCNDGGTSVSYAARFLLCPGIGTSAYTISGMFVITNITGNTWTEQHTFGRTDNNYTCWGGGSIALSGTLTQVRLVSSNDVDTFDAGTVNVMYE